MTMSSLTAPHWRTCGDFSLRRGRRLSVQQQSAPRMARQNWHRSLIWSVAFKKRMVKNSKNAQKQLASEANALPNEKPVFSPDCGPLSESEIASLKQSARRTAREVSGSDSKQESSSDQQL